ncbi:MAG: hypothetical protein ACRCY3_17075 [Sphingorhabdus sp.]
MSKTSSRRKSAASIAAQSDNVVHLPVVHRQVAAMLQPLLFADEELADTPPWLMEETVSASPAPQKAKRVRAKKPAAKKAAIRKPKKVAAKARTMGPSPLRQANAVKPTAPTNPVTPVVSETLQPIERAMAPVVWHKNGPIDALWFWLRSATRVVKSKIGSQPSKDITAKSAGLRMRSRNALLAELAVLRQENAAMRAKLNLPAAPLGRLVADKI